MRPAKQTMLVAIYLMSVVVAVFKIQWGVMGRLSAVTLAVATILTVVLVIGLFVA